MLAAMLLVALFGPHPALASAPHVECPVIPLEAAATGAPRCAALEVSGSVNSAGVSLDPAFDVLVRPAELTRPEPGPATLIGYARDGRVVFSVPFTADGRFRLNLALAPQLADSLTRLTLTANGATFERVATPSEVPTAEALATDETHVLFAWNARAFPAVRIAPDSGGPTILSASGAATFEQTTFGSSARHFVVSFSDGVHSTDRMVTVFGR